MILVSIRWHIRVVESKRRRYDIGGLKMPRGNIKQFLFAIIGGVASLISLAAFIRGEKIGTRRIPTDFSKRRILYQLNNRKVRVGFARSGMVLTS